MDKNAVNKIIELNKILTETVEEFSYKWDIPVESVLDFLDIYVPVFQEAQCVIQEVIDWQ